MIRTSLLASAVALASTAAYADDVNNIDVINKKFAKGQTKEIKTLSDAGRRSQVLIGTALSEGRLQADDTIYLDLLLSQFDYVTPENSGKWGSLQGSDPDVWDFSLHDQVFDFAQTNEKIYKGHTLVWHSQAPQFVDENLSAEDLQSAIDNNIATTMGRYAGEIYAWDVVNEVIGDDAEYRTSVLYNTLGEDFIADAFYAADAIDSKAVLYYNDYNIAGINAKSNKVYDMVSGLVASGVPIDGVGFQMHLTATGAPGYDELKANLQRFADLGLRVNISELDVRIADLPWDEPTNQAIQRQVYQRVAAACLAVDACESITTWGFTDAYSWIDTTFAEDDPLLYDESYFRKPAWYGLFDGILAIEPDALGTMPNLVANSQFESGADGWQAVTSNISQLSKNNSAYEGLSTLYVSDRISPESGASYALSDVLFSERTYSASAVVQIRGSKEEPVNLTLGYVCDDGTAGIINAATQTFTRHDWAEISGEFTLPACALETIELKIDGPAPGTDLLIDDVAVRPLTLVPNTEGLGENIVNNSDFESGADWWFGFGDAMVSVTAESSNSGEFAGIATGRTASWQGPAIDLASRAKPGSTYQVAAFVSAGEGSATINATAQAQCASQGTEYLYVGSASVVDGAFSLLSGTFTVPDCDLTALYLYFEGPAAEIDILIDDVYAFEVLPTEPSDNLLPNGNFENGTDGWFAWGGASIQATNVYAQSGTQSILANNRTQTYEGPATNILPYIVQGQIYNVDAWARIEGAATDTVNISLKLSCNGVDSYLQLDSKTANNTEWTALSGSVGIPVCGDLTEAVLYFEGPQAGVDIYIDAVTLTGATEPNGNLVSNGDFESGLSGWVVWGGELGLSDDAYSGDQSAVHYNRGANWQGPVYNMLSVAEAGASYDISGFAKLVGGTGDVAITVKSVCDDGSETYAFAGANTVADEWTQVSGNATLPECALTEVSVYFSNVDAPIDIYLDDVSITKVN